MTGATVYGYMQSTPHERSAEDFKEEESFEWGLEGCLGACL